MSSGVSDAIFRLHKTFIKWPSVMHLLKNLKRGLRTDLNLKRFPKFSNRISGSSSGDNESKIQKSLLLILAPKRS